MIVLDTHTFLWFVDRPDVIPKKALNQINEAALADRLLVSSISCWEIHMLVQKGRLELTIPSNVWVRNAEESGCFQFVPIDNMIAQISTELDLHGDPADRFIAATAFRYGATLISKDRKLRKSRQIRASWDQ